MTQLRSTEGPDDDASAKEVAGRAGVVERFNSTSPRQLVLTDEIVILAQDRFDAGATTKPSTVTRGVPASRSNN